MSLRKEAEKTLWRSYLPCTLDLRWPLHGRRRAIASKGQFWGSNPVMQSMQPFLIRISLNTAN